MRWPKGRKQSVGGREGSRVDWVCFDVLEHVIAAHVVACALTPPHVDTCPPPPPPTRCLCPAARASASRAMAGLGWVGGSGQEASQGVMVEGLPQFLTSEWFAHTNAGALRTYLRIKIFRRMLEQVGVGG